MKACHPSEQDHEKACYPGGFSLAELMIAIAILGMGLLVVATMFPIAWSKARDLSQHTAATAVAETAATTVDMVTRVDSAAECRNYTSFAGDYVVETKSSYGTTVPLSSFLNQGTPPDRNPPSDTRVHPLALENVLTVVPTGGSSPVIPEDTWLLMDGQYADASDRYRLTEDDDYTPDPNLGAVDVCPGQAEVRWYEQPQVLFGQRVHPPVDPYPDPASAHAAHEIAEWDARLDTRRYAWAVFHRLNEPIAHPLPGVPDFQALRRAAAQTARQFTMYYVSLRRNPGERFCRQDEAQLASASSEIKALEHTAAEPTDVKLPVPWLVPIQTPKAVGGSRALNYRDPLDHPDVVTRGVPTEVLVEVQAGTDDDYREFFPPGTQFIDSVNGEIYRVTKRRYDDSRFADEPMAQLEAILTLDREIFVEDLIDPVTALNPPHNEIPADPDDPTSRKERRRVWVYPPAIERLAKDQWTVQGASPVVDIDVRFRVIYPD